MSAEAVNKDAATSTIVVPDVRDYSRINAELTTLLDAGHRRIRLVGVDGQRLLAFGLRGGWSATLVIEGNAGPELAAELNAPNLVVACFGNAKDGAGRGLRAGQLWVAGDTDVGVGYTQSGGLILVKGSAGPRAGLKQAGGTLMVGQSVGRLAGERQSGGVFLAPGGSVGPFCGYGRTGGRFVRSEEMTDEDRHTYHDVIARFDGLPR